MAKRFNVSLIVLACITSSFELLASLCIPILKAVRRSRFIFLSILTISGLLIVVGCKPRSTGSELSSDFNPHTAEQLRMLVLSFAPQYTGSGEFFDAVQRNKNLREVYNNLIAADPELKESAEDGMKFRGEYIAVAKEEFPAESFSLTTNPLSYALKSLARIERMNSNRVLERPLSPWEARAIALTKTITRFGLKADIHESQLINENYDAHHFFKTEVDKLEQVTKPIQVEVNEENLVSSWKSHLIDRVNELRLENFRKILSDKSSNSRGSLYVEFLFSDELFSLHIKPNDLLNAKMAIHPNGEVPPDVKYVSLKSTFSLQQVPDQLAILNPLYLASDTLYSQLAYDSAAGRDHLSRAIDLQVNPLTHREYFESFEVLSIDLTEVEQSKAVKKIIDRFGPVLWLSHGGFRESILNLSDGKKYETVNGNMKRLFQIESDKRERTMASLVNALNQGGNSIVDLRKSLIKYSDIHLEQISGSYKSSYHNIGIKDGLTEEIDYLNGLKWWGYKDNPSYWRLRDHLALAEELPHFLFTQIVSQTQPAPTIRSKWRNIFTNSMIYFHRNRLRRSVVSAVSWSMLVWGASSGLEGLAPYLAPSGATANADAIMLQEFNRLNIIPKGKGADTEVYRIETNRGISKPNYYNLPLGEQIYDRRYSSGEIFLKHNDRVSNGDLVIESLGPHFIDNKQRFPLLLPEGFSLSGLQLFSGDDLLKQGQDYHVMQITPIGLYYVIVNPDKYPANSALNHPFRFKSAYTKVVDYSKTRANIELDPSKLKTLNDHYRHIGFTKLAANLDNLKDRATNENRYIGIKELAAVFSASSVYTYEKPKEDLDIQRPQISDIMKLLEDGCLFAQCNAGAPLFENYMDSYFSILGAQGRYDAENLWAFSDADHNGILTQAENHMHNRVVDFKNITYVDADATPGVILSPPKSGGMPEPLKNVGLQEIEWLIWGYVYNPEYERQTTICSNPRYFASLVS